MNTIGAHMDPLAQTNIQNKSNTAQTMKKNDGFVDQNTNEMARHSVSRHKQT